MLEQVAIALGSVLFCLVVFWATLVVFHHRLARAVAKVPGTAWTGPCVDPQQSRAWSVLVIDGDGITVRSLWSKETRYAFSWDQLDLPACGSHAVRIGLRQVQGLSVALAGGGHIDLLLPSRNLVRYPAATLDSALTALRRQRIRSRR